MLYYRSDEGAEFYCASDGGYYPRELLSGARAGSSPRMLGGSAEHDRSTYYEYIARHSAELPAQPGAAVAEAPAAPSAVPPRPATPPPAAPDSAAAPGSAGAAGGAVGTRDAGAAVTPAAPRGEGRRRLTGRLVVGAVALLAVLAVGIGLGVTFLGPDRGVRATAIETPEPDPGPNGSAPGGSPDGAEPPAAVPEQLETHVADGTRIAEERLEGRWVVQLSAKKPGLEADGRTWDDEAILEEFEENRRRHPEAVLLWSGDWSSFRLADFWVTVLAEPYDDPDEALATCRDLGLDRDHCFAKKLSTSEGPDGTTELND